MQQVGMEESLKRLENEMPLGEFTMENNPPQLTNTRELRFGFRRGWHACEWSVKGKLRKLFDAYGRWNHDPNTIGTLLSALDELSVDRELNDDL